MTYTEAKPRPEPGRARPGPNPALGAGPDLLVDLRPGKVNSVAGVLEDRG